MPTLPSFSSFMASSSEVSNPVFLAFLPITYWIVGAILGIAFIYLVIKVGEFLYHAVMNARHH